jgi:hypothetical protein
MPTLLFTVPACALRPTWMILPTTPPLLPRDRAMLPALGVTYGAGLARRASTLRLQGAGHLDPLCAMRPLARKWLPRALKGSASRLFVARLCSVRSPLLPNICTGKKSWAIKNYVSIERPELRRHYAEGRRVADHARLRILRRRRPGGGPAGSGGAQWETAANRAT